MFNSGLFFNQLNISLSSDGIALIYQARGLNKRILNQQFITLETQTTNADLPNWQPAIQQLDQVLSHLSVKPNTQMNMVLGSDFVRYMMLPAQPIAMSSAEKNAYANAAYRQIYGASANDWLIKCHAAAPFESTPAAAIDQLLVAALKQLATQYQLKLNSVQPYLMTAFNAFSPQLASANGYLVLLEQSQLLPKLLPKLLLVQLRKGVCQQLQSITVQQDWQATLNQILQRELLLNEQLDNTNKHIFMHAPSQKGVALKSIDGWEMQRIAHKKNSKIETNDARFFMLEAGM